MSLSRQVNSKLILRSHRALPMSIVRLVIRTLECRIHGRLFRGSLGQRVRLIARIWGNQRHRHMAVMVVTWGHARVLGMARDGIAARNIRTFRCSSCGRSAHQWHHKCLTVRRREVRTEVVVHGIAVTWRDCVEIGAVPKCGVRILTAGTLVLPSARLV